MIKASAQQPPLGRMLYIIGLSDENVRRLQAGKPILFKLDDVGGRGDVIIFNGHTEAAMQAELEKHMRPKE